MQRYDRKSRPPQRNEIKKILQNGEYLTLKPSEKISVAIVVIIPRYTDEGVLEVLTISEYNAFNPDMKTTKFPSGSIDGTDHDMFAAVKREALAETGYEVADIEYCWGAEYSSTKLNTQHFILFFIARQHRQVGKQTENIASVDWRPLNEEIPKYVTRAQRIALRPIVNKMPIRTVEEGYFVMELGRKFDAPVEGVYHVNL